MDLLRKEPLKQQNTRVRCSRTRAGGNPAGGYNLEKRKQQISVYLSLDYTETKYIHFPFNTFPMELMLPGCPLRKTHPGTSFLLQARATVVCPGQLNIGMQRNVRRCLPVFTVNSGQLAVNSQLQINNHLFQQIFIHHLSLIIERRTFPHLLYTFSGSLVRVGTCPPVFPIFPPPGQLLFC